MTPSLSMKDRELGDLCALPFQVCRFIEHHGIFCLLECTSVDPVVGYVVMGQMITVDWNAPGFVG